MSRAVLALADDLTGALEVGAKFAARGVSARVTTRCACDAGTETVLVIDTETRHLAPQAAEERIAGIVRGIEARLLYKKTDSTLRGNIASELRALRDAFPGRPLVYVPAYPQMGRTVRGGRLYVDGVPVECTHFARDPLNPARESGIAHVIEGVEARICDGETVAEIEAEAERIATADPLPIAVGPAALAEALAACLPLPRGDGPQWPRVGRCLAVNGSLHPTAAAQVEHARANGWRVAKPECAPGALAKGGWYLLDTADAAGVGAARAAAVGKLVTSIISAAPLDALVVFGGDTAFGMHSAFNPCDFVPLGEIVPGVPVSRRGECFWITKAGGFGGPEILCEIRKRLQ